MGCVSANVDYWWLLVPFAPHLHFLYLPCVTSTPNLPLGPPCLPAEPPIYSNMRISHTPCATLPEAVIFKSPWVSDAVYFTGSTPGGPFARFLSNSCQWLFTFSSIDEFVEPVLTLIVEHWPKTNEGACFYVCMLYLLYQKMVYVSYFVDYEMSNFQIQIQKFRL